ncbi:MAG: 23S rRNA (adenine(2030)-N(6))-methyltransferase RlmJ [Gammaproteobacteria bacterium]
MNYRHEFHAGNFADVMKHTLLVILLQALNRKPSAWCYFDTHAGAGCYDLQSKVALKSGESLSGIGRLWPHRSSAPVPVQQLCEIIAEFNRDLPAVATPRYYPGSACLAAALARGRDRLVLAELHPQEQRLLRERFRGDPRVAIHARDGYEMLKALVPPSERRGLVLMDPPFEQSNEYQAQLQALREAHARWPTGVYALWYPIKDQAVVQGFYRKLARSGIGHLLVAELHLTHAAAGFFGACGMLMVNPPWQSDAAIKAMLGYLAEVLAPGSGTSTVRWLVSNTQ